MNQTLTFKNRISVRARASIVGPKEGKGPLSQYFDVILEDDLLGKPTWEQAESEMIRRAILMAIEKGGRTPEDIGVVLAGDLLNQLMSSGFAARSLGTPFFGLYGACSTFVEGLVLGGVLVDRVFEPMMAAQAGGSLLVRIFGAGKGSGASLLFVIIGAAVVAGAAAATIVILKKKKA